jgi:hypothetical protein
MTYETLIDGYRDLYRSLVSDRGIANRIRAKLRHMSVPTYRGTSDGARLRLLARLVLRGVLAGGAPRIAQFARSVPWLEPRKIPLAIADWICGLSMRDYVERHFGMSEVRASVAPTGHRRALERAAATYVSSGHARIEVSADSRCFALHVTQLIDDGFLRRTRRPLARLLRRTPATLALHFPELPEHLLPDVAQWLRQLARYGDRVWLCVGDRLRATLPIDFSRFNLLLDCDCVPSLI